MFFILDFILVLISLKNKQEKEKNYIFSHNKLIYNVVEPKVHFKS